MPSKPYKKIYDSLIKRNFSDKIEEILQLNNISEEDFKQIDKSSEEALKLKCSCGEIFELQPNKFNLKLDPFNCGCNKEPTTFYEWLVQNNYSDKIDMILNENGMSISELKDIKMTSNKILNFVCETGHKYTRKIRDLGKSDTPFRCLICTDRALLTGYNDIQTRLPNIAQEFMEDKNGIKASEIIFNSRKKVWWKCKLCNFEYQSRV